MNKRERILLFVVLGIVAAYGMFVIVQRAFLGPLETQAAQIRNLKSDLTGKRKQLAEAKKAGDQLAEWEKISLPGDVDKAQSMYQAYLLELIRECHFEESTVIPEKIQKDKTGYFRTIPFTIRGKVTVEHLTDFMYRFYQPNLLHQIRSLAVNGDPKSKNLPVVITVAALSLDKAPDRERLIPESEESRGMMLAGKPRTDFELISQKNIFEPYEEPTKTPERKEPQIDEAEHTRLTACTQSSDEPEAWIYNRIKNVNTVLRAGDEFNIAGVKGKLVSVALSGIVIERDSREWTLKLGKTLKDLKEVPKPGQPLASEAKDKSAGNGAGNEGESDKPANSERTEATGDPEKPADDKPEKTHKDFPKDKPPAKTETR